MNIYERAWRAYIENSISRLVKELKQNKCLSQDFELLTKAEFAQKFLEAFDDLDEG